MKNIAPLIAQWKHGTTLIEGDSATIEVVAVFDHDFEQHLLVVGYSLPHHQRSFSLWFIGAHTDASLVKLWDQAEMPPFVEAAIIVQDWLELMAANSGGG